MAVRIQQDGHPDNKKKFTVFSMGINVYARKGQNVSFVLINHDGELMAEDVQERAGRTLNWFECAVFNYRTTSDGDDGFLGSGVFLTAFCLGFSIYSYYQIQVLSPLTLANFTHISPVFIIGLPIGWIAGMVLLVITSIDLFDRFIWRLGEIIDYSQRSYRGSVHGSVPWEFGFHATLSVGFAVLFYYGNGSINGFPIGAGWVVTVVLSYLITAMLAFPAAICAFLALTAGFAVREKPKVLLTK